MTDAKLHHVEDAFRAFAEDDFDAARSAFTDDAVLHAAGKGPLSGDYHGPDEIVTRFLRRGKEMCGGNLSLEPVSILPGNDYVMVFLRVRGERNGRTLEILCAEAAKLADDRRINEYWYLANDQAAEDSFYAD